MGVIGASVHSLKVTAGRQEDTPAGEEPADLLCGRVTKGRRARWSVSWGLARDSHRGPPGEQHELLISQPVPSFPPGLVPLGALALGLGAHGQGLRAILVFFFFHGDLSGGTTRAL